MDQPQEIEKTLIGQGLGFDAGADEPGTSMYQRLKTKVHDQLKGRTCTTKPAQSDRYSGPPNNRCLFEASSDLSF